MSAATPADRAVFLREADWIEEHCPDHGCVEPETDGCHCEIAERLRRLADEAQQQERSDVGTPEDRCAECGHFQGAHEEAEEPVSVGRCTVCADDDAWHNYEATEEERRLAGARRQPDAAPEQEPPVHGESVAHLADLHNGRDTWADDEDPARIDKLRPEFTDHASIEAIDAQLDRARRQERRWHIRAEWLISLRQARLVQPAVDVRQDGACPPGCIACATDESHDPTWARQDGAQS